MPLLPPARSMEVTLSEDILRFIKQAVHDLDVFGRGGDFMAEKIYAYVMETMEPQSPGRPEETTPAPIDENRLEDAVEETGPDWLKERGAYTKAVLDYLQRHYPRWFRSMEIYEALVANGTPMPIATVKGILRRHSKAKDGAVEYNYAGSYRGRS